MFVIKQVPEDFQVREIIDINYEEGPYSIFLLRKKSCTTFDAIEILSKKLRKKISDFGFAGNKDKNAITEQYISIHNLKQNKIPPLKHIALEFLGTSKERINLGNLKSNEFAITVRNLDSEFEPVKFVANYFDEQRFGFNFTNHLVGKALVRQEFQQACKLLNLIPLKNDFVGSLKTLNLRKLRFFIHSYQSLLFNKLLSSYIHQNSPSSFNVSYPLGSLTFSKKILENKTFPIPGFLTESDLYNEILKKEDITLKNFILKSFPELSSEGSERQIFFEPKNFKFELSDDELNKDKKKQILFFSLPKGSYATILIKKMFFITESDAINL